MARPHPGRIVPSPACGTLSRQNGRGKRRGRIVRRLTEGRARGIGVCCGLDFRESGDGSATLKDGTESARWRAGIAVAPREGTRPTYVGRTRKRIQPLQGSGFFLCFHPGWLVPRDPGLNASIPLGLKKRKCRMKKGDQLKGSSSPRPDCALTRLRHPLPSERAREKERGNCSRSHGNAARGTVYCAGARSRSSTQLLITG